jgi:hypothetical protein
VKCVSSSREGTDDGQTYSVLFHLSVWPSGAVKYEPSDGLTKDRRILFFLTESVWPSSAIPSQQPADNHQYYHLCAIEDVGSRVGS